MRKLNNRHIDDICALFLVLLSNVRHFLLSPILDFVFRAFSTFRNANDVLQIGEK